MGNYYVPLPGAKMPANAMLDFSGLNQAIDDYQNRQERNAMREYQQGRDVKADARASEEMGMRREDQSMQRERFGLEKKKYTREQSEAAVRGFAGILQTFDNYPADQHPALYQRARTYMKQHDPDFDDDMRSAGVDPEDYDAVRPMVMGIARGYQEPSNAEVKEVNGRLVRVAPGGMSAQEIYSGRPRSHEGGRKRGQAAHGARQAHAAVPRGTDRRRRDADGLQHQHVDRRHRHGLLDGEGARSWVRRSRDGD